MDLNTGGLCLTPGSAAQIGHLAQASGPRRSGSYRWEFQPLQRAGLLLTGT